MTSPLRRYISAFPRCTVTDSSCIAQRTNAPLGMRECVGDVHIGLGECVFVFPLCGFSLSLFCNYISGLYMGVLASCIVGVYEVPGVIQAWHLSFSIHAMPTECAISVGTEDRCMQYS